LRISTNHEKLGDVSVTLAQKGSKVDGDTQGADRASVKLNLPMKDLISNDDVTASVEYDVPSQVATVNLGYTSGDVNVGLKSNVNLDSQSATHKSVSPLKSTKTLRASSPSPRTSTNSAFRSPRMAVSTRMTSSFA
jgi:hypothetical protein